MEKINIKNVDEARQFVGRRVRLFWFDGREYQPRGEGTLRLGRLYSWDLVEVGESGLHSIGRNAVFLSVESDAWIELLDAHPEADRYAAMVGKRIKVVGPGGSDDYARFSARLAGGIVTAVDTTGLAQVVTVTWLTDSGDSHMCYIGPGFWPDVETARAEVARIEAEIAREATEAAEQKAREEREAEDARYPLPEGYHWEDPHTVANLEGDCIEIEIDYDSGQVCLWIDDPDGDFRIGAPLDVVRAVIARYDAEHDAEHDATDAKQEPYSIDIPAGCWASEVSHSFQDNDVIDLTFANGRVRRAVCRVDSDNDLLINIVGNVYDLGVTKVTLVSRGAQ